LKKNETGKLHIILKPAGKKCGGDNKWKYQVEAVKPNGVLTKGRRGRTTSQGEETRKKSQKEEDKTVQSGKEMRILTAGKTLSFH